MVGQDQWWQFLSCPQGEIQYTCCDSLSSPHSSSSLYCTLVLRFDVGTVNSLYSIYVLYSHLFLYLSFGVFLDFTVAICAQMTYFSTVCCILSWPCTTFCLFLNEGLLPSTARSRLLFMWTMHLWGRMVWKTMPIPEVLWHEWHPEQGALWDSRWSPLQWKR